MIVHDVYGAWWDKSSSPILTRTDSSVGLVANAGIDDQVVQNDFDNIPLFKAIHEVTDDPGECIYPYSQGLYIKKTKKTMVGVKNLARVALSDRDFIYPGVFGTPFK